MNEFAFYMPAQVIFGRGKVSEVGKEAQKLGKKGLVVTDKGLLATGLVQRVIDSLESQKADYLVWSDIVPNPRDVDIERGAAFAKENKIDYLIAIGGGSAMDTAKAIGAIMTNGGKCEDWYEGNLEKPIAPLICIPTTCGTGSEVTHESIVNNTKTLEKDCIWGPMVSASLTILDSELLDKLPGKILASTGMDALTHAIEGYITAGAWELSDMFHLKAIEIISRSLRGAVENTPEGREGMALGQYVAGMGFSNVGLGIVHSMAHPLGALYDTPHGIANAIILPTVMEYNAEATGEKYRDIAKAMGVEGTENMSQEEYRKAAVDAVRKLSQDVGIPADLKEIVKKEDIPFLAQSAYDDACRPGNPKETSVEDITKLYESLL